MTPFNKKPGAPRVPPAYQPHRGGGPASLAKPAALAVQAKVAVPPPFIPGFPGRIVQRMEAVKAFPPKAGRQHMVFEELRKKVTYAPNGSAQIWLAMVSRCTSMDELQREVANLSSAQMANIEKENAEKKARGEASTARHAEEQRQARIEREAKEKREAEEARMRERERIARIEANQQPKPRRRMESLARLLESSRNVCVAIVEVKGSLFAATNEGPLSPLQFHAGVLDVLDLEGTTGFDSDRPRARRRDASKVSSFLEEREGAEAYANVTQVEAGLGDLVHAEMKILNFLFGLGVKGTVQIYISKLCCRKCEVSLNHWNASGTGLVINAPGGHGNHYPGWEFPPCIAGDMRDAITEKLNDLPSENRKKNYRGRTEVPNNYTHRERSLSPPPEGRKLREFSGK
jgi:hypothetical protein